MGKTKPRDTRILGLFLSILPMILPNIGCNDSLDEAERYVLQAQEKTGITGDQRVTTIGDCNVPHFIGNEKNQPNNFVGCFQSQQNREWISLSAFDGQSFQEIWKTVPMKLERPSSSSRPHLAVAGTNVLIATQKKTLKIFKGSDGTERTSMDFDSEIRDFCVSESGDLAWIDLASTRHTLVKLENLELSPSKRPSWCPEMEKLERTSILYRCGLNHGGRFCRQDLGEETFEIGLPFSRYFLENGRYGVVVGEKHHAHHLPRPWTTIVGYQPGRFAPMWTKELGGYAHHTGLTDHRLVAVLAKSIHTGTNSGRLVSYDLRTGSELWNVELPWANQQILGPIVMTEERIFLLREGWFDIFELESGQILANVGKTP